MGLSVQGENSGKTILGLSVQGGNRIGSTLVLSNKNHVEVIIIFILQHGFCSTKPGYNNMDFTLFPPWTFNPRMVFTLLGWVFIKNQPKKSRLDVYNFFLCLSVTAVYVTLSRVNLA